jgi:hypothetical protein
MTDTIERPEWATDVADEGLSDGPIFTRRLKAHASVATTMQTIGTSGHDPYRLGFELTQRGDNDVLLESDELPAAWFMITDPGAARLIASALLEAADEWQEIRDAEMRHEMAGNLARLMEERDIDVAGLADRLEIPAERIEALLDESTDFDTVEVVLLCHVLDVNPRRLLPARYSA